MTGFCKIKYCATYNDNTETCITCRNGFILDRNNNKFCIPINCKTFNIGSDLCS